MRPEIYQAANATIEGWRQNQGSTGILLDNGTEIVVPPFSDEWVKQHLLGNTITIENGAGDGDTDKVVCIRSAQGIVASLRIPDSSIVFS